MLLMESSPDTGTQDSVRMTGSVVGRLSTGALLLLKENESIPSRETPDTPWRRYINMYRQTSEPEFPQASLKKLKARRESLTVRPFHFLTFTKPQKRLLCKIKHSTKQLPVCKDMEKL